MILTPLWPTLLGVLSRAGVDWVYVESDLAEGIAPGPLLPSPHEDACRETLEAVFDIERRHNGCVPSRHVDGLCQMAAEVLVAVRARGRAPLSHDPTRPDDDPVGHALAVATIGLAIGEIIVPTTVVPADAVAWHLTHLGAGLLLHDIGTMATPPDVLSTRGALNDMQREMVRWHTQAGEQMVSGTVPPHVALVPAQHHEWFAEGGYPTGVAGDDIHMNACIAAVADAYHALATRSLTTAGRPSDVGLRVVRMWTGTAFDPAVVDALEQVIAPFAPGCPVLLSDQSRGIVAKNTPGRPQQPTVRVTHGPDGEALTPEDCVLTDDVTATQVIDHPSQPPATKRPAGAEPPRAPSLAVRGIEAGACWRRRRGQGRPHHRDHRFRGGGRVPVRFWRAAGTTTGETSMRKRLRGFIPGVVIAILATGAATAHVDVLPAEAVVGEAHEFVIRVPTEREGIATTGVRVAFPKQVVVVRFAVAPGWTRRTVTASDGSIEGVVYQGGRVGRDEYAEFRLIATPVEAGTARWKVEQTYADGVVKPWTGPAEKEGEPVAESGPTDPGPSPSTTFVATPSAAAAAGGSGDDSSPAAIWLGIIAIGIAGGAIVATGFLWSTRPMPLPPDDEQVVPAPAASDPAPGSAPKGNPPHKRRSG